MNSEEVPKKRRTFETDTIQALMQMSVDLAEIYSPPRVTSEGKKFGLNPGEAMDLTTGWDFRRSDHRAEAKEYIRTMKPFLVIGSPMCTMFSQLQALTGWSEEKNNMWLEAVKHIEFVVEIYRMQVQAGRLFLHEHPASASS